MMHIAVHEIIRRPAAEVFRFVATEHFEHHPMWDTSIREMTQTSRGPMGIGTTCRVVRTQGVGELEVTEYEPDRTFATRSDIGPFAVHMRCSFAPLGPSETRLDLRSDVAAQGPMRLVAPLLRPVFRRTMARSLATIRSLVEQGSSRGP